MIAVPLRYKRAERGLFIQKLQHAVPSIVVLGDGLAHLSHNPRGAELALGVLEVGAATAVMVSVVKGIRQLRRAAPAADTHAQHGIDWIDLFIGVMLAVEANAKFNASGKLRRPTNLLAVSMVANGLMHGKIAAFGDRRRELRVDTDGISLPGRFFQRLSLAWTDVAAIDIGERYARVTANDGRTQRLDLTDVLNPTAVRDALMTANTFLENARHAASASIESATPHHA
ncbi:MAG: hypothetical protein ACKOEC_03430 [Acidimicrobiia bacterium]